MDTKVWGPAGWVFLHTTTFNYPTKIDLRNKRHRDIKKYTRQLFNNLRHTLPCKYCRQSFAEFLKELPIDDNLGTRQDLTWWLYSIHNLVNAKLRRQERQALSKALDKMYRAAKRDGWRKQRVQKAEIRLQDEILYTACDPSYEDVCHQYESYRAKCSSVKSGIKTCRLPRSK